MYRKSLILYASWGGNTEKVAMTFKKVFKRKGWQCDTLKVTKKTDIKHPGVNLSDYDMLLVGSLVIGGLPTKELYDDHFGLLMPASLIPGRVARYGEFESITTNNEFTKGIIFLTYTGGRRGPPEAAAAMSILELRLEDMRVKVIGKFACPGGHGNSPSAQSQVISKNEEHDIADYFGSSPEAEPSTSANQGEPRESNGPRDWHWDVEQRPGKRDLLKAEIFLEEILEDYYEGGIEAAALAQYICIA